MKKFEVSDETNVAWKFIEATTLLLELKHLDIDRVKLYESIMYIIQQLMDSYIEHMDYSIDYDPNLSMLSLYLDFYDKAIEKFNYYEKEININGYFNK